MSDKYIDNVKMPDSTVLKIGGIPSGGPTGSVLTKKSPITNDCAWVMPIRITADEETIRENGDLSFTAIGQLTKDGHVQYDWVGTYAEWQEASLNGSVQANWTCFITDVGEAVVPTSAPIVSASIDYVDRKVDPFQQDYLEFKQQTLNNIAKLNEIDASYGERLDAIEQALGTLLDEINGEVI